MAANQLRLWFCSFAYVLIAALRRLGLPHTEFEAATCGTIRLKLLKIGAHVTLSVRCIKIVIASPMFACARRRREPPSPPDPKLRTAERRRVPAGTRHDRTQSTATADAGNPRTACSCARRTNVPTRAHIPQLAVATGSGEISRLDSEKRTTAISLHGHANGQRAASRIAEFGHLPSSGTVGLIRYCLYPFTLATERQTNASAKNSVGG
jgi:hypothetical protein